MKRLLGSLGVLAFVAVLWLALDRKPAASPRGDASPAPTRLPSPIASASAPLSAPTHPATPPNPFARPATTAAFPPGATAPSPAPHRADGLWPAVTHLPHGSVILATVTPTRHDDRPALRHDRVIRVEGRRYPAVRLVQTVVPSAGHPDGLVVQTTEMVADQILVNLAPDVTVADLAAATGLPLSLRRVIPGTGTAVIAFPVESPDAPDRILAALAPARSGTAEPFRSTAHPVSTALIHYAEPDHLVRVASTPNDPRYADGSLWAMHNTGQNSGVADADVDAPEGWAVRTSALSSAITQSRASRSALGFGVNELVVAVVDTGVRYTHQDIAANMWTNPGEIPANGIDDDANGVIDDIHGINAVADTGDPADDNGHGTHCAGTIAAVGNNGLGVAGIAWQAKIVACKFLAADGSGANSDASEALWYAWEQAGADVISCSWGGGVESTEVTNQIRAAGLNGALVVVAAGNDSKDLEETPTYPAASQAPSIVTVASSTRRDEPSSFTNYNYGWANLFAPGSDILSLGISSDSSYQTLSGTSMATPLVAGVATLLRAQYPNDTYGQIINRLHRSVDKKAAYDKKALAGGRINYDLAIRSTDPTPFNDDFADASEMPSLGATSVRITNFHATSEPSEPAHAGSPSHRTLWFKWTAPATRTYNLSTRGSSYGLVTPGSGDTPDTYSVATLDTTLAVYTGASLAALTPVAANDDYAGVSSTGLWSRAALPATAGTTYYFAVGTKASAAPHDEGMIILALSEPPANDTFPAATTVSATPFSSDTANSGALTDPGEPQLRRTDVTSPAFFPAEAPQRIRDAVLDAYPDKLGQLEPGGASLWWKWTPSVTAEYAVSTEGSFIDTLLGIYTATNPAGASFAQRGLSLVAENDDIGLLRMGTEWVMLTASRVRRTFTAGVTYYIQIDTLGGREGPVTFSISRPPANDHIADATLMSGLVWSAPVNNVGASFESGEPKHHDEYGGVSVWYRWVAPSTQDHQVSMSVSTIATNYAVYTASNPAAPDVTQLTPIAGTSGITGSGFRFSATAGQTYFFAVDGLNGRQRPDMRLDLSTPPGAMLNDHFAERVRLFGTSARVTSDTGAASFETGEPDKFGSALQRSVWWTWTAPATGNVTFTTQYSTYNAALGIYTGSALGSLTEIAYQQPANGQGASAFGTVTFQANRGTTYHIAVFGNASYCGPLTLNLAMSLANQLPEITAASLSATGTLFADQPLAVSSVTTADAENNFVSVAYQWQTSPDGQTWTNLPDATSATLPATDSLAGFHARCALTPSDATGDGNLFYTARVEIRRRPVQLARHGQPFAHTPALPVLDPLPPQKRRAIINEFAKGAGTPTQTGTLNGEWYELLVLRDSDLRGWLFGNVFRGIRFLDTPLWQNVPRGTLIVIYNPTNKHALLPADDVSTSDGNFRIVVSGSNSAYFDNGNDLGGIVTNNSPTCPKLSGDADTLSNSLGTGARLVLNRGFTGNIDDISYVSTDLLGPDAQFKKTPHLQTWLGGGQAYRYTRDNEDFSESSSNWELGAADASFATPGQPNTLAQADWINQLRAPAPRYRFAASSQTPSGLSIDETTGAITGTIDQPAGGLFRVVVERHAPGYATATAAFDLLVATADRAYTLEAGRTFTLQRDLDLGTATLLNRGTLVTNGFTLAQKQSYATWAAATGAPSDPDAPLARLGSTHRLAFALNLDPATATVADLPAVSTTTDNGSTYLTLTHRRQKAPNRLAYVVEKSSDLVTWTPATTQLGSVTALDHATERVTIRDDIALTPGTRRFLRLRVTDNLTPPATPATAEAALGIAQVALTWSPVSGADSYTVRRSTTGGSGFTDLATGLTTTAYTDATVATGTTYYYVIVPVSLDDGPGAPTAQMSVTTPASWLPAAPADLVATADAARIALTWSPVPGAASYTVRRSTTGGSGYTDLATGLTATAYADTTAIIGTTYYYVVTATNAGGTSPASAQTSGALVMPLAWWKLDETSGTTAANSGTAGSAQNAALQNSTGVAWSAGKRANAATLDGATSSYFRAANNLTTGTTNTVTITLWVKADLSTAGWRGLFYDRSGSVQKGIHTNNGVLRIGNWENDNQTASTLTLPANTWTFVALAVSPTQMRAYLRAESASSFSTWTSATTSFTARQWQRPGIGGSNFPAEVLPGQLDDIRFYDRTLTETELSAIFANSTK